MMSPVEYLRRMLPLIRIGVLLAVVTVALNAVIVAVASVYPEWPPRRLAGAGFARDIRQRVEAAAGEYARDAIGKDQYLCAILGLSAQREAVDLETLAEIDGLECRYLGLSGAGGTLSTMVRDSGVLLDSGLRPDLVVMGINPHLLVDPLYVRELAEQRQQAADEHSADPWDEDEPVTPWGKRWSALLRGEWRPIARGMINWFWVHDRRRDLSVAVEEVLTGFKYGMIRSIGGTTDVGQNPLKDPWREMIRLEMPEQAASANLRRQIASYRARGLFTDVSYAEDGIAGQIDDLARIIRELRAIGSTVVIVFMPEHTELRTNVPDTVIPRFRQMLEQRLGGELPQIVMTRDALPDDQFADIAHVNTAGRAAYNAIFAKIVADHLPTDRTPLMTDGR